MGEMNRLGPEDFKKSLVSAVGKMADGNPGAVVAMKELMDKSPRGVIDLFHMDEMKMYGPAIWIGFKDYCEGDGAKFAKAVCFRDEKMVEFINKHPGLPKGGEVIVGK